MSDTSSPQILFDAVSERLRAELARQSEKAAMREASLSRATVSRARAGIAPGRSAKLLYALKRMGTEAALRVLEPVLGPMDDASLARRLDAILRDVGAIKHAVATSALAQDQNGVVGQGVGSVGGASRGIGGEGQRLALVISRRPATTLEGLAPLRELSNVVSLDGARRLKAQHRNVGLAWRARNSDWLVDPAEDNRLWKGSTGVRPLTAFPSAVHVEPLRRGFAEAVASADPVAFEQTGFLDNEFIHAFVERRGWVDGDGVEICAAAFRRIA